MITKRVSHAIDIIREAKGYTRFVSGRRLCTAAGLRYSYFKEIVVVLTRAGIMKGTRGAGYEYNRDVKVTLYDLIELFQIRSYRQLYESDKEEMMAEVIKTLKSIHI